MIARSLYADETFALASMHAKENAIARPLQRWLGAKLRVATAVNTDEFGTFTGERPRSGTMLDAARAKANAAIETTVSAFGLGSEGSFGPHPSLPFLAGETEIILFIDRQRGFETHETLVTAKTNYRSIRCKPTDDIGAFLTSVRFPSHGLVVTANQGEDESQIVKGITSPLDLSHAIRNACSLSQDGLALVTTDMRAHFNPTRMATIRALSSRLARRLATSCPACASPGFGAADLVRGLPCRWCGEPTELAVATVHRCVSCDFKTVNSIAKPHETADPGQCQQCNP